MSGNYSKEPAKRAFIAELRETTHSFEADGVSYALLPSGERCNRVLVAGALTRFTENDAENPLQTAVISDSTEEITVSAFAEYQPYAHSELKRLKEQESEIPPAYVMVYGRVNTYEQDGQSKVAIQAENLRVIDKETYQLWVTDTLISTQKRLQDDIDGELADDVYTMRYNFLNEEDFDNLRDILK